MLSDPRNQNVFQLLMNQAPQECSVSDIKAGITKISLHSISVVVIQGVINCGFQFPMHA